MKTKTQSPTKSNARVYRLQQPAVSPIVTPPQVALNAKERKPVKTPLPRPVPQPLHPTEVPTPAPGCSLIKVGLDIDLKALTATVHNGIIWIPSRPASSRAQTNWSSGSGN